MNAASSLLKKSGGGRGVAAGAAARDEAAAPSIVTAPNAPVALRIDLRENSDMHHRCTTGGAASWLPFARSRQSRPPFSITHLEILMLLTTRVTPFASCAIDAAISLCNPVSTMPLRYTT
jgi:hypothetical protein